MKVLRTPYSMIAFGGQNCKAYLRVLKSLHVLNDQATASGTRFTFSFCCETGFPPDKACHYHTPDVRTEDRRGIAVVRQKRTAKSSTVVYAGMPVSARWQYALVWIAKALKKTTKKPERKGASKSLPIAKGSRERKRHQRGHHHHRRARCQDLAALERTSTALPLSFLGVPPEIGVAAWRRSIAAAERTSPLARALTRKHFSLLAPRGGDAAHRQFIEEQVPRVHEEETQLKECLPDGGRFATLGFCDLMSLHLCSGSRASVRIPLTHPADPESHKADYVTVSVAQGVIQVDRPRCWSSGLISIDGWIRSEPNRLSAMTFEWRLA
jgi:hypothetical protein